MNHLSIHALEDFPLIRPNDNLSSIIIDSIINNNISIDNGDVILIAQKVVSKSENRYKDLSKINPSKEAINIGESLDRDPAFIQLILEESNEILSTDKNVIIVEHKLGYININAGIDRSNISENKNLVLLLPENPKKSATYIQSQISKQLKKDISIIITDSMTRPYRAGITNFAIASSNIQSLIDLRGEEDIFGNKLLATEIAIADELAAASGLLMGQGNDMKPVVIIKGFDRSKYSINNAFDLIINKDDDLYRF